MSAQQTHETRAPDPVHLTHAPFVSAYESYGSTSDNTVHLAFPTVTAKSPLKVAYCLPVWSALLNAIGGFPAVILEKVCITVQPCIGEGTVNIGASLRPYASAATHDLSPSSAAQWVNGLTDTFSIFNPSTRTLQLSMEQSLSPFIFPCLNAGAMPTIVLSAAASSTSSATIILVVHYKTFGSRVSRIQVSAPTSSGSDSKVFQPNYTVGTFLSITADEESESSTS
jgi:hypothetical protein